MTEFEKMRNGEFYDYSTEELLETYFRARRNRLPWSNHLRQMHHWCRKCGCEGYSFRLNGRRKSM